VVAEGEGAAIIIEETIIVDDSLEVESVIEEHEDKEVQEEVAEYLDQAAGKKQSQPNDWSPIPTNGSMIKPPPKPVKEEDATLEAASANSNEGLDEPTISPIEKPGFDALDQIVTKELEAPEAYTPNASVFAENATMISKQMKQFLNFVQILDSNHGFSNFEGCVSCYYQFQKLNFNLEADSILYLNLAADLGNYLSDLSADRLNAEIRAAEHWEQLRIVSAETLETY